MGSLMAPIDLTLSDFERSQSMPFIYSVMEERYSVNVYLLVDLTLIWMSHYAVWRAGFSAVPAVFPVLYCIT